jgi:hypothetical protein
MEDLLRLESDAGAIHHDFIMKSARPDWQYNSRRCHVTTHGQSIHYWQFLATAPALYDELLAETQNIRSYCIATEGTGRSDEFQ